MMDYIQESGRAARDGFLAASYVVTCGPIETWQRNQPSSQLDIESDENTAKFGVFSSTSEIIQKRCGRVYIDSFIDDKNRQKRYSYCSNDFRLWTHVPWTKIVVLLEI